MSDADLQRRVRDAYRAIALGERSGCCPAAGCCAVSGSEAGNPTIGDLGLSCGDAVRLAGLQPGERVLDLGCGAGRDVFRAAVQVGPGGLALGVDMTEAMLRRALALRAAAVGPAAAPVAFLLARIEELPLPDACVEVVISDCVLNLSPDQPRVWREVARVLAPGGRVAICDIAALHPLPPELRHDAEAWAGCLAGAATIEETRRWMAAAGLAGITIRPRGQITLGMGGSSVVAALPSRDASVASIDITAQKA